MDATGLYQDELAESAFWVANDKVVVMRLTAAFHAAPRTSILPLQEEAHA